MSLEEQPQHFDTTSLEAQQLDLLAAFKARFNIPSPSDPTTPADTRVLSDAEFVAHNAIDVSISMAGTKSAAASIWARMKEQAYSTSVWSQHELHPKPEEGEEAAVEFIFAMDVLNFSFWSEKGPGERFEVEWRGRRWSGYWSLVAGLRRAREEGVEVVRPGFWQGEESCSEEVLRGVFRSATAEGMPMFEERVACLREAGRVVCERFEGSFVNCVRKAEKSAARLVNMLVENFECFRDKHPFEGRNVHFYKRAQILVADLWACFEGKSYGEFYDIDKITVFPDYRIPQMLHSLGCMYYSPPLESRISRGELIESGHPWEVQIRGCSIWTAELIRREIKEIDPEANVNAILIDYFLYDTAKAKEEEGQPLSPHHRTRSIWY